MSTEIPDPAEAIAQALSRLRGRRPREGGPFGAGPGGPFEGRGPRGGHGGPHGHDGHHAHGHGPHGGHGPGWGGGRFGGPAWVRMLEALAGASDPLSVSELGDAIGVDQPRASRLVQQGVARGLVRREADPDDARRTRIALTDEGRGLVRGVRGQRRESLGLALDAFTSAERDELARLLTKLADNWQR